MTVLDFGISLAIIVVAAELFTNAVEWAGFRLKLGSGATGSLLAALGTSLPEATVPIVALVTRSQNSNSVAIGAVLGSPMLLLGIGMGITGIAVAVRRNPGRLEVEHGSARRDLSVFLAAFVVIMLVAVVSPPKAVKILIAVALVLTYAFYVRAVLRASKPEEKMPEPLHFLRWDADRRVGGIAITLQLLVSVGLLIGASDLFVSAINNAAAFLRLDPLTVAVVLAPVATELPETLNSVLWVRTRSDTLAFGNVAGSAVFQACLLGALGLAFTTWDVGRSGLASMVTTLIVAVYLWFAFWRRGTARGSLLALAVLPWIGFVVYEITTR